MSSTLGYKFDEAIFKSTFGKWWKIGSPTLPSRLTGITDARGLSWCITGKFKNKYKRDNIEFVIEDLGGYIEDKVSFRTDVLVATDAVPWDTKKLKAARDMGATIMTEDEFERNILQKHPDYGKGKW